MTTIQDNNERLRRMINEVLDVSKIESGTRIVHLSEASAEGLINQAIDGVNVFLNGRNLKIRKEIIGIHSLLKVYP